MMNYGGENWIILNLFLRYMYNEENIKKKKKGKYYLQIEPVRDLFS
jgi:hypothetical protein